MAGPTFFPTRGHLLVCVGPQCSRRGSGTLHAELTRALETEGLAYYKRGGTVRMTVAGCLGACDHGPTVALYRREAGALVEAWYHRVDRPLGVSLARAIQDESPLPDDRRFDG